MTIAATKPVPVLYLAWAPFFSGAERALLLTLRTLDPARYTPHVIVGTDGELAARVRELRIPCSVIPLKQLDKKHLVSSGASIARVIAAAARLRPGIIHSNDMPSFQPGGIAGRLLGIPTVTHLRFPDTGEGYRWFFRPRFSLAVFISRSFRDDAMAEAPELFRDRTTVIYDAVDLPAMWSVSEREAQRARLGFASGQTVVALTGQIAEIKGIWEFVEAANRLRDTNATFAVLGDDLRTGGAVRKQMEEKVAALGLTSRFHFLGFRNDAPTLCQAFDIVAAPSHVEPLGLASLEAMAVTRPVVASRVGGIPEVVEEDVTGLLVPPRDASALADGLRRLLADADLRESMGRAGRARAERVFGMPIHGASLQHAYDNLRGRA